MNTYRILFSQALLLLACILCLPKLSVGQNPPDLDSLYIFERAFGYNSHDFFAIEVGRRMIVPNNRAAYYDFQSGIDVRPVITGHISTVVHPACPYFPGTTHTLAIKMDLVDIADGSPKGYFLTCIPDFSFYLCDDETPTPLCDVGSLEPLRFYNPPPQFDSATLYPWGGTPNPEGGCLMLDPSNPQCGCTSQIGYFFRDRVPAAWGALCCYPEPTPYNYYPYDICPSIPRPEPVACASCRCPYSTQNEAICVWGDPDLPASVVCAAGCNGAPV